MRMRPSRLFLRHSVVSRSGWRAASSSAISRVCSRTTSWTCVRRSGAMTWMPREPLVIAYGSRPSSRSSSPIASAPSRMWSKSAPSSGGSRSKIMRSGRSRRSARLVHTCGVTQLTCAEPAQRVGVVGHRVGDGAAAAPRHLDACDPLRRALRDRLLDDDRPLDPGVPAPQVQRPLARVRDHRRRDRLVVAREVGLGDPVGREQDLVRVAELHVCHASRTIASTSAPIRNETADT